MLDNLIVTVVVEASTIALKTFRWQLCCLNENENNKKYIIPKYS